MATTTVMTEYQEFVQWLERKQREDGPVGWIARIVHGCCVGRTEFSSYLHLGEHFVNNHGFETEAMERYDKVKQAFREERVAKMNKAQASEDAKSDEQKSIKVEFSEADATETGGPNLTALAITKMALKKVARGDTLTPMDITIVLMEELTSDRYECPGGHVNEDGEDLALGACREYIQIETRDDEDGEGPYGIASGSCAEALELDEYDEEKQHTHALFGMWRDRLRLRILAIKMMGLKPEYALHRANE